MVLSQSTVNKKKLSPGLIFSQPLLSGGLFSGRRCTQSARGGRGGGGGIIFIVLRCMLQTKDAPNRAFSYDVTAAILVFQNKETAAILVYQVIPLGIKLYFYAKIVICFSKPIWLLVT